MRLLILASFLSAGLALEGLENIDHVVLFMQENRAFDHYYGTVAGVRGFKDPNVDKFDDGKPMWYQPAPSGKDADYLLPWYLSENQDYAESNQCSLGGSNDWTPNHNAWNFGAINGWATNNTAYSWGHYRRSDIPTLFDIVEGWTIADMYAEGVMGPTSPNRVTWISGTININETQGDPEEIGGPYIDNYETPGCENKNGIKYACYPLRWKTVPEYLEEQGIDWYVFQDKNNFDDNPLAWFGQVQDASKTDPLTVKGNSFTGLQEFYDRAANGTLPPVSYIIGPMELSEHPPNRPVDGSWLQQKVVEAVTSSPKYKSTALIISYDETGGYGDHVTPFISPESTPGEWLLDPEADKDDIQFVPSGPGFRVPMYVISPWTRGGKVYTAPSDHNSQIKFLERWVKARFGKDITTKQMDKWRRDHMDDLVDMFDFENPDCSIPNITAAPKPTQFGGFWLGSVGCLVRWLGRRPTVPYGQQNITSALWTETGYKQIRGSLTEGRYLAFENNGKCLTASGSKLTATGCSESLSDKDQLWIVHQQGDTFTSSFKIQSADNNKYLKGDSFMDDFGNADTFAIEFGSGGYSIKNADNQYLSISGKYESSATYFKGYSVSYN